MFTLNYRVMPLYSKQYHSFTHVQVYNYWSKFCSHSIIEQCHYYYYYYSAHSPTSSSLHLRHNSFSNLSVASPTSQLIIQPFRHFTYVTAHSPILPVLHVRHSSFFNPSFASPMSQALHLFHLASRPCRTYILIWRRGVRSVLYVVARDL